MNLAILILITLLAIYFANVICCAIICEAIEEAEIAKSLIFYMPIMIVALFFYFAFIDRDDNYTRLQGIIGFIKIPAKNLLVAEGCAEVIKKQNRQISFKADKQHKRVPKMSSLAQAFTSRMVFLYSTH